MLCKYYLVKIGLSIKTTRFAIALLNSLEDDIFYFLVFLRYGCDPLTVPYKLFSITILTKVFGDVHMLKHVLNNS